MNNGERKNNYCTVNSMPQRQADIQTEIYEINGPIENISRTLLEAKKMRVHNERRLQS